MKKLLILLCFSLVCLSQTKDYVSGLNFDSIYTNDLSLDFVVLGMCGNEMSKHYESCKLQELSYYSYDTIWNIHHLGQTSEVQKKPRIAFLNNNNFHLLDFEIWDSKAGTFIIGPYQPYLNEYDYYIGNGFAINDLNELKDYNQDGYLDRKVQYTKLDYDKSHHLIRAISNSIFSEYQDKLNLSEINKEVVFDEYSAKEWMLNNNFELFGFGYITRYSNQGLIYFIAKE